MTSIETSINPNLYDENRKKHSAMQLAQNEARDKRVDSLSTAYERLPSRFQDALSQKAETIYNELKSSRSNGNEIPQAIKKFGMVSERVYKYLIDKIDSGDTDGVISCLKVMIDPVRVSETRCIQGATYLDSAESALEKSKKEIALTNSNGPRAIIELRDDYRVKASQRLAARYFRKAESEQISVLNAIRSFPDSKPEYLKFMFGQKKEKVVAEAELRHSGEGSEAYQYSGAMDRLRTEHYRTIGDIHKSSLAASASITAGYSATETLARAKHAPGSVHHEQIKFARKTLGIELPKPPSSGIQTEIPSTDETRTFIASLDRRTSNVSNFGLAINLATYASTHGGESIKNSNLDTKEKALVGLRLIPADHPQRSDLINDAALKNIITDKEKQTLLNNTEVIKKMTNDWESSFERFAEKQPAEQKIANGVQKLVDGGHSPLKLRGILLNTTNSDLKRVLIAAIREIESKTTA